MADDDGRVVGESTGGLFARPLQPLLEGHEEARGDVHVSSVPDAHVAAHALGEQKGGQVAALGNVGACRAQSDAPQWQLTRVHALEDALVDGHHRFDEARVALQYRHMDGTQRVLGLDPRTHCCQPLALAPLS